MMTHRLKSDDREGGKGSIIQEPSADVGGWLAKHLNWERVSVCFIFSLSVAIELLFYNKMDCGQSAVGAYARDLEEMLGGAKSKPTARLLVVHF